jgi:hypothetical protein
MSDIAAGDLRAWSSGSQPMATSRVARSYVACQGRLNHPQGCLGDLAFSVTPPQAARAARYGSKPSRCGPVTWPVALSLPAWQACSKLRAVPGLLCQAVRPVPMLRSHGAGRCG